MTFRKMEYTDIPAGLALCRSANWNQLSRDWEIFLTSSEGNRVCVADDGTVIGTVTTIKYEDHFAWVGMVLVDPAHQRKGVGLQLMEEALIILQGESCIKLDATPAGRQVYIKLGFQDEYNLNRMYSESVFWEKIPSSQASPLSSADLVKLAPLDETVFGANRMSVLSRLIEDAPMRAFKVEANSRIAGYCFGREGFRFAHIGPVVATDIELAKQLVSAALLRCKGKPVILDVPDHNPLWRQWLESIGFSTLRSFVRMFKGDNRYPGKAENQFAILGPEFG